MASGKAVCRGTLPGFVVWCLVNGLVPSPSPRRSPRWQRDVTADENRHHPVIRSPSQEGRAPNSIGVARRRERSSQIPRLCRGSATKSEPRRCGWLLTTYSEPRSWGGSVERFRRHQATYKTAHSQSTGIENGIPRCASTTTLPSSRTNLPCAWSIGSPARACPMIGPKSKLVGRRPVGSWPIGRGPLARRPSS